MPSPPGVATWLLRRVLPRADAARLIGDMDELYRARARRFGVEPARAWYRRQVWVFAGRMLIDRSARGGQAVVNVLSGRGTGGGEMSRMAREIARGVRRLSRAPVFTVVSVATVGVAIGAFASAFSVVDTVLLEEPPYEDPGELVWIWRDYSWIDIHRGWLGGPDVTELRAHDDVFEDVVAFRGGNMNLTGPDGTEPTSVLVLQVSAGFFDLLGVTPSLGSGFRSGEDLPGAAPVAVLGHDLWVTGYGRDPSPGGRGARRGRRRHRRAVGQSGTSALGGRAEVGPGGRSPAGALDATGSRDLPPVGARRQPRDAASRAGGRPRHRAGRARGARGGREVAEAERARRERVDRRSRSGPRAGAHCAGPGRTSRSACGRARAAWGRRRPPAHAPAWSPRRWP